MVEIDLRHTRAVATDVSGDLERGRECYGRRAWQAAYDALSRADRQQSLSEDDLERLAMSAYMSGRDGEYLNALERAYQGYLDNNAYLRASRCAFWCSLRLLFRGEIGPSIGWLARAQRLLEREKPDCAEQGYVLIHVAQRHASSGDWDNAFETALRAAEIGVHCQERDLVAVARHLQGRVLLEQGHSEQGLRLLDEVMVAVTAGELSPLVTGLIYCSVIEGCQQVYAFRRAREWTSALAHWCDDQPELVAFKGVCLVHRAEIMQLQGAWQEASAEAQRACERCLETGNKQAVGAGFYQLAELYRLRGEYAAAEQAYCNASDWGWEPQPGFALLRMAQSRTDAAATSIRRVLSVTNDRLQRIKLLPACVEIMLAINELQEAHEACCELEEIATKWGVDDRTVLATIAAQARGAVQLANGDTTAALITLREAWRGWQQIEAPYLAARVRVLMGLACRALGDEESSRLELDAARKLFEQLGAAPDVASIDALAGKRASSGAHALTARELQVLRLLATGKKNRTIADELFLSERTVDRHVSKILDKLNVPSRTAATAYAYEHQLI